MAHSQNGLGLLPPDIATILSWSENLDRPVAVWPGTRAVDGSTCGLHTGNKLQDLRPVYAQQIQYFRHASKRCAQLSHFTAKSTLLTKYV